MSTNKFYIKNIFILKRIPVEGLKNLQNQLFGLEIHFEKLKAIDFKKRMLYRIKTTARMKLKNKLRKKLMAIKTDKNFKIGDELKFNPLVKSEEYLLETIILICFN